MPSLARSLAREGTREKNHPTEKKPGEMPDVFASFERREAREPAPESMLSRAQDV